MTSNIVVTIIRDIEKLYPSGGLVRAIPIESYAVREELVSLVTPPPNFFVDTNFPTQTCLKIVIPGRGYAWISQTMAEFELLQQQAGATGDQEKQVTWIIGTDVTVSGSTITAPELYKAQVHQVDYNKLNIVLPPSGAPITNDPATQEGTIDFAGLIDGPLLDGDILHIAYRTT